jgi:hypothetical protein
VLFAGERDEVLKLTDVHRKAQGSGAQGSSLMGSGF